MGTSTNGKGVTPEVDRLRNVSRRLDELEREFVELKARVDRLRAAHIALGGNVFPSDTSSPEPSTESPTAIPAQHGAKCPTDSPKMD